jgi:hypothetical protein
MKYGVWCIDEGCFYDPTPRGWNDAVDATALNCRTNTSHRFEVRELPTPPGDLVELEALSERTLVVAWIREAAKIDQIGNLVDIADAIERGEHR